MPSPIAVARRIADDVLFPSAGEVDRAERIPESNLKALAKAGLFGIAGPREHDGLELDPAVMRRVLAAIGSGCGATFFVWAQHHGVVRTLAASENSALRHDVLGPMCWGEMLAGTAFAHLRRDGDPAVLATRSGDGWRLDGVAPWATSWGIADRFAVAAVDPDDTVVWCLVNGRTPPLGVEAARLGLPVFGATRTVELTFRGLEVPDESVIATLPRSQWLAADARRAAMAQPAAIGLADRAVRLLAAGPGRRDPLAGELAGRLAGELNAAWALDDELTEAIAAGEDRTEEAAWHRASVLDTAHRATTALVAACGGAAMGLRHPAQRLAREASFYVIQAQTAAGRDAMLRSLLR